MSAVDGGDRDVTPTWMQERSTVTGDSAVSQTSRPDGGGPAATGVDRPRAILVVAPGGGQDEGGIQRLTAALIGLLPDDATVRIIEPAGGPLWQVRLAGRLWRAAWGLRTARPAVVLCLHGAFLPLAAVAAAVMRGAGVVTFYYGQEIWSAGPLRRLGWRRLRHVPVTISGYSAGALAAIVRRAPAVLVPPLPPEWAGRFVHTDRSGRSGPLQVLSVFRLRASRAKRPEVIIEAVEQLRGEGFDIELTLAGRGPAGAELVQAAVARGWLHLVDSPTDEDLAACYRAADVFVLATGVSLHRRRPSGEGFGIVLVEAALAGLPVVGPAAGGSRDAMVDGYSGEVVADERAETLADALRRLAVDPAGRADLGRRGRRWAVGLVSAERAERNRRLLGSLMAEAIALGARRRPG